MSRAAAGVGRWQFGPRPTSAVSSDRSSGLRWVPVALVALEVAGRLLSGLGEMGCTDRDGCRG
jgi:hypothetical protein